MHHFIQKIYLRNSINAAVSRGGDVYGANASRTAKLAFKEDCKLLLKRLGNRYVAQEWNMDRYCTEIEEFQKTISGAHGPTLHASQLKIGTAQKMISLYLKYLWLSGDPTKEPICAVLDRAILQVCGYPNPPAWTKLNDIKIYKDIQIVIQQIARHEGFDSAAVWEAANWETEDDGDA